MVGDGREWLAAQPLPAATRKQVTVALAMIDALEQQPSGGVRLVLQESEYLVDETGLLPANSRGSSRLAEILAGESGGNEIRVLEPCYVAHIPDEDAGVLETSV